MPSGAVQITFTFVILMWGIVRVGSQGTWTLGLRLACTLSGGGLPAGGVTVSPCIGGAGRTGLISVASTLPVWEGSTGDHPPEFGVWSGLGDLRNLRDRVFLFFHDLPDTVE